MGEVSIKDVLAFNVVQDCWGDTWCANGFIWREVWKTVVDLLQLSPVIFDFYCQSCLELELPNVSLLDFVGKVVKVSSPKHVVVDVGIKTHTPQYVLHLTMMNNYY